MNHYRAEFSTTSPLVFTAPDDAAALHRARGIDRSTIHRLTAVYDGEGRVIWERSDVAQAA